MIFLDTDVMVDILRAYPPACNWLESQSAIESITVSGFVAMELYQGCRDKSAQRMVREFLTRFTLLWPEAATCDQALATFASGRLSHSLGLLDALIGQQAVALDVPLFTFNAKHFAAVPGLRTLQPYVRASA